MAESLVELLKPDQFPEVVSPDDILRRLAVFDWIAGALLVSHAWPAPVLGLSADEVYADLDSLTGETAEAVRLCLRILGLPVQPFMTMRSFQTYADPLAAYEGLYDRPWLIEIVSKHHTKESVAAFCAVRSACYIASVIHYRQACATGKPLRPDEGPLPEISRRVAEVIKKVTPLADVQIQLAGHRFLSWPHATNNVVMMTMEEAEALTDEHKLQPFSEMTLTSLVPGISLWSSQPQRARAIVKRLDACPPGRDSWKEYEDICLDALRFLFVPPFRRVIEQARTADGTQRRDAVIPNVGASNFWESIRREYDSKNIVVECKNLTESVGADELGQLRIYLRKPTVGRFGILLARKTDGDAWKAVRRTAYADDRALILVLDDKTLKRALVSKAYLGNCDFLLEELKVEFELSY